MITPKGVTAQIPPLFVLTDTYLLQCLCVDVVIGPSTRGRDYILPGFSALIQLHILQFADFGHQSYFILDSEQQYYPQ